MLTPEGFARFWSGTAMAANAMVLLNLLGALLLGLVVGYERSYHGRAAGMRTYGLVCMASAALTVIGGYSPEWFGGLDATRSAGDITRVIQGIVTGIGFLGAGVIMHEGFNISGLTTAASLWTSSVIGILVGVGFYAAAIALAVISAVCMVWVSKLEAWLPSHQAVAITLSFRAGTLPSEQRLRELVQAHGYDIATGTIAIASRDGQIEWRFVAVAVARNCQTMGPMPELARQIADLGDVTNFQLTHARN